MFEFSVSFILLCFLSCQIKIDLVWFQRKCWKRKEIEFLLFYFIFCCLGHNSTLHLTMSNSAIWLCWVQFSTFHRWNDKKIFIISFIIFYFFLFFILQPKEFQSFINFEKVGKTYSVSSLHFLKIRYNLFMHIYFFSLSHGEYSWKYILSKQNGNFGILL